jgi:hypothetical protein
MTKIKETFDTNKDIFRTIEKVITFDTLDNDALKREVTEYVVTEKLKNNFQKLLDALHSGMDAESHEVGIWVSGFYGSGKSSFSKNFGLALDKNLIIDGVPFRDRLSNRINNLPITQQLKTLVEKYNPQVFLINLATKRLGLHGNMLPPVSDILYHQVMKWAGYAPEEKVALLERKLEMDNKFDEFKALIKKEKDEDWDKIKFEDTLTAKALASEYAVFFYPKIWRDERAFNILRIDSLEDESDRMRAMLDIIKKRTGKENVLFIIDEVGQYISAKEELITHMQGTMENLKDIGKGKAWLLATAQQTLTEDNPNARYNSDKLFKLNDRFPIKVDIEASDIKEITTQRLLGKSDSGTELLKSLFSKSGEKLRLQTRLTNVEKTIYKSELDEKAFLNLYPFLPYQFDIILSLLAKLAKKTGGIGLRSAIRVIQDVLTEKDKNVFLAEEPIGNLATAYHIYNVLGTDIRKSYPHISNSVEKVIQIFGEDTFETKIAKSIAVLQVLDDFHLSIENLAVTMYPSIDSNGILPELKLKIEELKKNKGLTLKEIDGQLRFMTDAIIRIEEEKQKEFVSGPDMRKVLENQIEDLFTPVPNARILNTKTVKAGIQLIWDSRMSKLLEPNEEIQVELNYTNKSNYTQKLNDLKSASTEKSNDKKLYFIGQIEDGIDKLLEEIVRCEKIYNTRGKYSDKEIGDYLNSQFQEADRLKSQVKRMLGVALENGEMLFRGSSKATSQLGSTLREASNAWLKSCAEKIFDKYNQAPLSLDSSDAQKLLQYDDLKQLPPALKHFDVIKADGGIDINIPSIHSIKDYLQAEGQADGRKLLEFFMSAPYGWHRDTTRYLIAAMFIASEIKLRIAGDWVKVKGPSSVEKLSSTQNFHQVGITLFTEGQPTMEQIAAAIKNITELTGEVVAPLPLKISQVVMKHFPRLQSRYADLPLRLENLNLPGKDKAISIKEDIEEILKADASDATFRLGKENAELFVSLKWAKNIYAAIEQGIDKTIKEIQSLKSAIEALPSEGVMDDLKNQLQTKFDEIERIFNSDNFYEKAPELNDYLMEINNSIASTCDLFRSQENISIEEQINKLKKSFNWGKLTSEQKSEFSSRLDGAIITEKVGVTGIREIINESYSFTKLMANIKVEIEECLKAAVPIPGGKKRKTISLSHLPKSIEKIEDVNVIISELEVVKGQIKDDEIIDLNW